MAKMFSVFFSLAEKFEFEGKSCIRLEIVACITLVWQVCQRASAMEILTFYKKFIQLQNRVIQSSFVIGWNIFTFELAFQQNINLKIVHEICDEKCRKPQLVSCICPSWQFWIIFSLFQMFSKKGFAFLNKTIHLGNSEAYCANGSLDSFLCRSGIVYNEGGPCKNMLGCLKSV